MFILQPNERINTPNSTKYRAAACRITVHLQPRRTFQLLLKDTLLRLKFCIQELLLLAIFRHQGPWLCRRSMRVRRIWQIWTRLLWMAIEILGQMDKGNREGWVRGAHLLIWRETCCSSKYMSLVRCNILRRWLMSTKELNTVPQIESSMESQINNSKFSCQLLIKELTRSTNLVISMLVALLLAGTKICKFNIFNRQECPSNSR